MPDRELVLRERCGHGKKEAHNVWRNDDHMPTRCPGGSETVLDPVVLAQIIHDLQQEHGLETRHDIGLAVIDALGGSDE